MTTGNRSDSARWSLKNQIRALGFLALATLVLAIALGVRWLRESTAARVDDAMAKLERGGAQLIARYASLQQGRGSSPIDGDDDTLRSVTEMVLASAPGVEGGFYSAGIQRLLGYAYPTYPGSGPKTDIPAAEQPTILRLAQVAVAKRGVAEQRVDAGRELILFHAQAIPGTPGPEGAVWLMQRLADPEGPYSQLFGLGAVVLLLTSTAVASGAWLLTRRLDHGVSGIEAGVRGMESHLDRPMPTVGIPELDRIGAAIEGFGHALHETQTRRAELEQRLRQADRLAALGRLVAGVAHEVRNPLASIQLKLQLGRRGSAEPERLAEVFEVIQIEVDRLNRLVSRLLSLGKPSEATARVSTDLRHLLGERLDLWRSRAQDRQIGLRLVVDPSLADGVICDRDRLGQIVDNLIVNAFDAIGESGEIAIEARRSGPAEVLLAVCDTGPGVPAELADRIFEPFFTTRSDGTGLGLFLSAEIARQLGGELRYVPSPGRGARFEVRLPC